MVHKEFSTASSQSTEILELIAFQFSRSTQAHSTPLKLVLTTYSCSPQQLFLFPLEKMPWNHPTYLEQITLTHPLDQGAFTQLEQSYTMEKTQPKQNISSGTSFPHQIKYRYETLYIMHSKLMRKFKNVPLPLNPRNFSCMDKQTWGMPLSFWQLKKMICL